VKDIVFSYSGIRPLPRSDHAFTGRITRSHFVHRVDGATPQFCMVGGKWTTFRAFAEQTTDAVLAELGRKRVRGTLGLAIGGGAGFPDDAAELQAGIAKRHGIKAERAAYLVDLYGTRADAVMEYCRSRDDDCPLDGTTLTTAAEIAYLAANEFVVGLEDMLLRRTPLAITGKVSADMAGRVAEVMAAEHGWSSERTANEIAAFVRNLSDYHGVSQEALEQRSQGRSLTCA
jgi:glycerol-3-phosphate dehydrogenase